MKENSRYLILTAWSVEMGIMSWLKGDESDKQEEEYKQNGLQHVLQHEQEEVAEHDEEQGIARLHGGDRHSRSWDLRSGKIPSDMALKYRRNGGMGRISVNHTLVGGGDGSFLVMRYFRGASEIVVTKWHCQCSRPRTATPGDRTLDWVIMSYTLLATSITC